MGGGGWRNQGTDLDPAATQLLPESRKRRKHSEIICVNTRFGTEGSEVQILSPRPIQIPKRPDFPGNLAFAFLRAVSSKGSGSLRSEPSVRRFTSPFPSSCSRCPTRPRFAGSVRRTPPAGQVLPGHATRHRPPIAVSRTPPWKSICCRPIRELSARSTVPTSGRVPRQSAQGAFESTSGDSPEDIISCDRHDQLMKARLGL
jgi:hypothetical protein